MGRSKKKKKKSVSFEKEPLTLTLQTEVDNAAEFAVVLSHFEEWMESRGLVTHHSVAIVTDGSALFE